MDRWGLIPALIMLLNHLKADDRYIVGIVIARIP